MADEFQHYYGVVFIGILNSFRDHKFTFCEYNTKSRSSYLIELGSQRVGMYIKYSTKRMSPWGFTFKKEHQDEIEKMKKEICEVFVIFVCGEDGIAVLNCNELKKVLNEAPDGF